MRKVIPSAMAMGGSSTHPMSPATAPAGHQPPWNVGERWADGPRYAARRIALKVPIGKVADVMTTPYGTFAQNSNQGTLLYNGNVLMAHRSGANNAPFIYNPGTNTLSNLPFTTVSGNAVQLPDSTLLSLIAGAPGAIYDLTHGRIRTLSTTLPATVVFSRLSGWVFLLYIPGGSIYKYDVRDDLLTKMASTWPASGFDYWPIVLQDGRVFIPPVTSTTGRVYDLAADYMRTTSCTFPNVGANAFAGSCVLHTGEVFCSPRNSQIANIYDPLTDTVRTVSGFDNSGASYNYGVSCVLMPDGRVLIPPFALNGGYAKMYDPVTNTVSSTSMLWPSPYGMSNAVCLQDGRIYCCPYNSTTARIYGSAAYSLPAARLLPSLVTPGNSSLA